MVSLSIPSATAETKVINQDVPVVYSPRLNGAPIIGTPSCNLTVSYNGTLLIPYGVMTYNAVSQTVNYTIPRTNITRTGEYSKVATCCIGTSCGTEQASFTVNKSGLETDSTLPFFYIGLLVISFGLFIFSLWSYKNLQASDSYNEFDELVQINWKKHFKPVLLILTICLFIWSVFNSWVVASNFLDLDGMSRILFYMWTYPIAVAPYLLGLWGLIFMYNVYKDFMKTLEIERFGNA